MEKIRIAPLSLVAAWLVALHLVAVSSAEAGARRFTYVYEATTSSRATSRSRPG
jgi:hypothetical protein